VWKRLCAQFSVANFDLRMPTVTQLDDPIGVFRKFAHTAADVATGLGFDAFHVFGWTGGTHIALRCAIEFPQRVKSCVLLCPFHELPDMRPFEKGLDIMHAMMACEDRELYAYFWFAAGLSSQFISANFDRVERLAKERAARDAFVKLDTARMTKWA
jgi:pimeloyl-ACP methyl ester carboxylesterase